MRILLVEDEAEAARALSRALVENTFAVDIASTGSQAIEKAWDNQYDLVLLDLMLPDTNGFEVCARLRQQGFVCPVLMLTALDSVDHRIDGLDAGADDYLSKPFDLRELLARIRALLRRGPALRQSRIEVGDLVVDTRTRRVTRHGEVISLTAKEYALLEYLAIRQGEVLSREEIAEHVWNENYDPFSNSIEVFIQRLRRKIEPPGATRLLETRRGEGYRLSASLAG
jgi:DNA-binding response OmpR family regulator